MKTFFKEFCALLFSLISSSVLLCLILTALLLPAQAFAQASAGGPPAYLQVVPIIFAIVIIMYMQSRTQLKKQKEQKSFLESLKRGDRVVTASGILGSVEGLTEAFVTLEIAANVKIKILKTQIAGLQDEVKS